MAEGNQPDPSEAKTGGDCTPTPQELCDREFDKYETERETLRKTELDAEKNYDTMLTTLSAGALAGCWTVWTNISSGKSPDYGIFLLGIAWVSFAVSLAASLLDRKFTYDAHKSWRKTLDEEFQNWSVGAFQRADEKYEKLPGIKTLRYIKNVSLWTLFIGIGFFTIFLMLNYKATAISPTPTLAPIAPSSQVTNVIVASPSANAGSTAATQPTTNPVHP